jgi:transcriptional regulator of acetoin/glycerol metabolism
MRSRGELIRKEHLPGELRGEDSLTITRGPARKLDPESVRAALERTGGNKARAARLLGVGRATLYRFLNDYAGEVEE